MDFEDIANWMFLTVWGSVLLWLLYSTLILGVRY